MVEVGESPPRGSRPTSPTVRLEAMSNLIKRVERAAFEFRSFRNYRIRELLYAGKTQLVTTSDRYAPLKSGEPVNLTLIS